MKTERVFIVTEWYSSELQDFVKFNDAEEGFATAQRYLETIQSQVDEAGISSKVTQSISPNGDFNIEVVTKGETYGLEGYWDTNFIH